MKKSLLFLSMLIISISSFSQYQFKHVYGIGIQDRKVGRYLQVTSLSPSGSAMKSGEIMIGDILVKVGEELADSMIDIADMENYKITNLIHGDNGTKVKLTLQKQDGSYKTITLPREDLGGYVDMEGFIGFLKDRFKPVGNDPWQNCRLSNLSEQDSLRRIIHDKHADYYYQIALDERGKLVGYNIYGAHLWEYTKDAITSEDVITKNINKPCFIDLNGNVTDGQILIEESRKLRVFAKVLPPNDNGYIESVDSKMFTYQIGDLSVYDNDLKDNTFGNKLFDVINEVRERKVNKIDFIEDINKWGVISSKYYKFSCDISMTANIKPSGIIDSSGNIIYDNLFDDVKYIKNKNGIDYFYIDNKDGNDYHTYGIAKSDGSYVFEPNFSVLEITNNNFTKSGLSKVCYNGKFGMIDKDYNVVIEPEYSNITVISSKYALVNFRINGRDYIDFFNLETKKRNGVNYDKIFVGGVEDRDTAKNSRKLIPVEKGNLWGYCDFTGKVVIPIIYIYVGFFSENLALVYTRDPSPYVYDIYNRKGLMMYIINKQGTRIATFSTTLAYDISEIGDFHEGLAKFKSRSKNLYGFFNINAQIVVPAIFEEAGDFYNYDARGAKCGVVRFGARYSIDKKGNRID